MCGGLEHSVQVDYQLVLLDIPTNSKNPLLIRKAAWGWEHRLDARFFNGHTFFVADVRSNSLALLAFGRVGELMRLKDP